MTTEIKGRAITNFHGLVILNITVVSIEWAAGLTLRSKSTWRDGAVGQKTVDDLCMRPCMRTAHALCIKGQIFYFHVL